MRHLLREELQFLQGAGEIAVFGMALDIDQELGRGEIAVDHVAFELGHVDAIGGEAAERLVERRRHVFHAEDEGGQHRRRRRAAPFAARATG